MRAVVADEVARLEVDGELTWERLGAAVRPHHAARSSSATGARDDSELTELLEDLMGEANRIAGLSTSDAYYELYGRLERTLIDPEPGSLVARIADAPQTDTTRVVQQLPHWMFAMRDTLGANASARWRRSSRAAASDDLEGALQEAMRLWPTTPLLARETTRETTLAGEKLDEGTQVMIVNVVQPPRPRRVPGRRPLQARALVQRRARRLPLQRALARDAGLPRRRAGLADRARRCWRGRWSAGSSRLVEPRLPADGDLPHMVDFYSIRFEVTA